jgi:hypothetical protein
MNRALFSILFFSFVLVGKMNGQNDTIIPPDSTWMLDPIYQAATAPSCKAKIVDVTSVVLYTNGAKAYLRFATSPGGIKYKTTTAETYQTAIFEGTEIVLQNLLPNQIYEVFANNSCQNSVMVNKFSTQTGVLSTVEVSPQMNQLVKDWIKAGNIPLKTVLNTRTDIPFMERLSFYQQYWLKNTPLNPTFNGTSMPTLPTVSFVECNCNTITTKEGVTIGTLNNGTIEHASQPGGWPKTEFSGSSGGIGNNADWWFVLANGGAMKYHQLWTEGRKAKKNQFYSKAIRFGDETSSALQKSYIQITFVCGDGQELPSECQCEKEIHLNWRYDHRLTPSAKLYSSGNGSKKANAKAEETAAIFWHDGTAALPIVLDGLTSQVVASCGTDPNPNWWTNLGTVAIDIAKIVLVTQDGIEKTTITQQMITDLGTAITTFINTPKSLAFGCNQGEDLLATRDGHNNYQKLLVNKTAELGVYSISRMEVGGQRSWFSHARILSDYYLTAFLPGGLLLGQPAHCCSQRVASWNTCSILGAPNTSEKLKVLLAGPLIPYFPDLPRTSGNEATVIRDYGWHYINSYDEQCNDIIINPGGGGSGGGGFYKLENTSGSLPTIWAETYDFKVWDVQGRQLASSNGITNLKSWIDEYSNGNQFKIILVQTRKDGKMASYKFFIQ